MNEGFSKEEIWRRVGQITVTYPLLECDRCAVAVARWLERWKVGYQILRLKTRRRREVFVISDRHHPNESITENEIHYGVEVMGLVFDNLSAEGMIRDEWVQDFHCLSGQFVVDEVSLLLLELDSVAEK